MPTSLDGSTDNAEYKVGQLYEPTELPDFGSKLFQNQGSKLVQHEVLNIDHQLIPPWKQYEALRTGTLVMATVTLHCFSMKVKDLQGNETGKERKVIIFLKTILRSLTSATRFTKSTSIGF